MKNCVFHNWLSWGCGVLCFGFGCGPMAECLAQVVQLPAIHTFSYSGTVVAPDAGIAYQAGVLNSAQGSTSRGWGPYAGLASGSAMTAGHSSLSAMIIDLKAMDDAILGISTPPAAVRGARHSGSNPLISQPYGYAKSNVRLPDPNSWQRALASGSSTRVGSMNDRAEQDVRYFLEKAEDSLKENRLAAARVFRRMAMERMTPDLRARMEQRAKEIQAVSSGKPADSTRSDAAGSADDRSSPADVASAVHKRKF